MKKSFIFLGVWLSALPSPSAAVCKEYVSRTTRGSEEYTSPVIVCGRKRDLKLLDDSLRGKKELKHGNPDDSLQRKPRPWEYRVHADHIWFAVRIIVDLVGIASVGQYAWRCFRKPDPEVCQNRKTQGENMFLTNRVRNLTSQLNAATRANELNESSSVDGDQNEVRNLANENQNLRDQLTCKVCMDAEVGVIFWPCSHITCCPDCAVRCEECPICRQLVYARMKAFIN